MAASLDRVIPLDNNQIKRYIADITLDVSLTINITSFPGAKAFANVQFQSEAYVTADAVALQTGACDISEDGTSCTVYGWESDGTVNAAAKPARLLVDCYI